jgi:predicted RNA-binding protein
LTSWSNGLKKSLQPETESPSLPLEKRAGGDLEKEKTMCEANAYLMKEGKEELILEDISILRPEKDELYLQNIFGEQKRIKARIKEMNLIDHRIILEESR